MFRRKKNKKLANIRLKIADQHVLSDRSGQGRSASKHTAGYCPTNSSASPMVFSFPESTRLDTGSGIGQSPEGPDSTGGESWAREFVWDSRTGNEVQVSGVKRRSEEEKEDLAKLREQGGACEECRRKHRKVSAWIFHPYSASLELTFPISVATVQVGHLV